MPSSVSAIDGITAITQKNKAAIQKPSASGTFTFIHLNKNKYCAVKIRQRSSDIPSTSNCRRVVTRVSNLP